MIKTIFCDIDGTLVRHRGFGVSGQICHEESKETFLLPGTVEKLNEWQMKGHTIVLTTGRVESQRSKTEKQLSNLGIIWDILIMGLPRGQRIIINDLKGDSKISDIDCLSTAQAICLTRNKGIGEIEL